MLRPACLERDIVGTADENGPPSFSRRVHCVGISAVQLPLRLDSLPEKRRGRAWLLVWRQETCEETTWQDQRG